MRVIIVGVLLMIATAASFALGRITVRTAVPEAPTETGEREITARIGDAFRVSPLTLYCLSYVELDRPKLLCEHTSKRPRYEVIFERNRTIVVRIGHPEDRTIFPER